MGAVHLGRRNRQARLYPALSRGAPTRHPDWRVAEEACCWCTAEVQTFTHAEAWQPDDRNRNRGLVTVLPAQGFTRTWTVGPALPDCPPERYFRWYIGAAERHWEVDPLTTMFDDPCEKSMVIAIFRWKVYVGIMFSLYGYYFVERLRLSGKVI